MVIQCLGWHAMSSRLEKETSSINDIKRRQKQRVKKRRVDKSFIVNSEFIFAFTDFSEKERHIFHMYVLEVLYSV